MASRKDFAQNKRSKQSASRTKPAPKKPPVKKVAPIEPEVQSSTSTRRRPWLLISLSGLSLCALVYGLIQLINVDPRSIRESGISAIISETASNTPSNDAKTPPDTQKTKINKPENNKKADTSKPVDTKKNTPPVQEKSTVAEQKAPYQFYKLLAEESVETEEIPAYKSTPKTAKLEKKSLLQTGSFRNQSDAERMKARLILNNLPNVNVGKIVTENGTWYRVRTGPFDNFQSLKSAQNKLNKLNILPIEIKIR